MKYHIEITLFMILFLVCGLWSQPRMAKYHYQALLNCGECHSCDKPTYKDPCLKICPDLKREGNTLLSAASQVPELVTIDKIAKIYEPGIFTHKLHAEMSQMSGGCESCHHHNPPGKVLACIECHEPSKKRDDISKPGLSGAYHQQCLNCHREWSHQTNCTVCHAEKGSAARSDKSELAGKTHPQVEIPQKLIYKTEAEQPFVTFLHDAHTNTYGATCVECHKEEACSRCHDAMKKQSIKEKETHENCMACHEKKIDDNCQYCHANAERNTFDHENTGWKLNKFHKKLICRSCHKEGEGAKPEKKCTSCHDNLVSGKFDHSVTGLKLDEIHIENDCGDCHSHSNFTKKTVCDDCHEGYSYPKMKPGALKTNKQN